jgi:hypothetical protein
MSQIHGPSFSVSSGQFGNGFNVILSHFHGVLSAGAPQGFGLSFRRTRKAGLPQ